MQRRPVGKFLWLGPRSRRNFLSAAPSPFCGSVRRATAETVPATSGITIEFGSSGRATRRRRGRAGETVRPIFLRPASACFAGRPERGSPIGDGIEREPHHGGSSQAGSCGIAQVVKRPDVSKIFFCRGRGRGPARAAMTRCPNASASRRRSSRPIIARRTDVGSIACWRWLSMTTIVPGTSRRVERLAEPLRRTRHGSAGSRSRTGLGAATVCDVSAHVGLTYWGGSGRIARHAVVSD